MDRHHDPRLPQPLRLVHVPEQHRHGAGLPLVHVQHVRLAAADLEVLERGAAEVEVGLRLVVAAAVDAGAPAGR